jgi:anthranilate phosphoribosyltransferase
MTATNTTQAHMLMRSILQRIATGPELSKDIRLEEARDAMIAILKDQVDPVQSALFLIALRMKRESNDEFKGILDGVREMVDGVVADVDHVVDIADPYDGYNRTLPAAPFLPPLLAECGLHPVSHGLDAVGPKYGVTHRHILEAAGAEVNLNSREAARRLSSPELGWSYLDQANFCKPLHNLIPLRTQMIKRQVLTTVEVLAKPVMGKSQTHFVSGYVHKPYPPIYAMLARHVGFDSALLIRGVEGGIIPSLRQDGKYFSYHDHGEEIGVDIHPCMLDINQSLRAVPLPEDLPKTSRPGDEISIAVDIRDTALAAADAGMQALNGKQGITYDSLVYTGALILRHMGKHKSLKTAADAIRAVLNSGKAANRVK